jgi:hypothetical protein
MNTRLPFPLCLNDGQEFHRARFFALTLDKIA